MFFACKNTAFLNSDYDSTWKNEHTAVYSISNLMCFSGGEPIAPIDTTTLAAAREAESGAWIQQLEDPKGPPKILAPGMTRGAFATWDQGNYDWLSLHLRIP